MRVFITGMTGSLGTALAKLHHSRGDTVWGCARDESRAVEWFQQHSEIATLYVTDAASLFCPHSDIGRLLPSMARLYHCAAMKHVDICERYPLEAVKQNVVLTADVAVACACAIVPMVFISSDKACLPQGVYGATKLLAERIVLSMDGLDGSVVRLGNLIGSSGSVFSLWKQQLDEGKPIRLTDPTMTRYFIPVEEAARFVADKAVTGVVSIPDPLLSTRMGTVAGYLQISAKPSGPASLPLEIVGRRPGETRDQWLVAPGESVIKSKHNGALMLSGTHVTQVGMCSLTAPRWDTNDLLKAAGIFLPGKCQV